jgi:hypothetical protein
MVFLPDLKALQAHTLIPPRLLQTVKALRRHDVNEK